MVSLKPKNASKGNVLLSYIIDPFLLKPGQPIPHSHTQYWESFQIAKTWLDLGYAVDVISYLNHRFIPSKHYSFFIDVRTNLERLAPLLNQDCVKIMHIDICHTLFTNAADANRLLALQRRKSVTLQLRRFEHPNLAIEYADCATVLGNKFTIDTFKYANKPLHRVPISNPFLYPWPEQKDFANCRRSYLWFGSGGFVRKGLDRVLDAFAAMPEYQLTVCGPIKDEKDFEALYYKELYETPNIHTIGWTDVGSPQFLETANNCIGLIYPSCAEGQCGGVITCMHAGLIPLVSYESGVDVEDFGVVLRNCSIEEIKRSVFELSNLSVEELGKMARMAWQFARANHTKEKFAEEYRRVVTELIATYPARRRMENADLPKRHLIGA